MVSVIDEIKALPIDKRREAIKEILESFPEDDPIFENALVEEDAEKLSTEEKILVDERLKKVESGEAIIYSREEMDQMIRDKFRIHALQT
jgi:vacuolar-type H+-ATPase subunit E/Vma4